MEYKNIFKKNNARDKCTSKSFHELLEAFKKEGCPLCGVVSFSIDSYFESILYEFVNDPGVRSELRKSSGYCSLHTNQFIKTVEQTHQRLGATIIAEDLIKNWKEKIGLRISTDKEDSKRSLKKNKCPACRKGDNYEEIYIAELLGNLRDEEFLEGYNKSEGLCKNHFKKVAKFCRNPEVLNKIVKAQKKQIEIISQRLEAYIKKNEYRNKEKITTEEANACIKALKKISGI